LAVKHQTTQAKPAKHNLVVVEVAGQRRRVRNKPHLFVFRTQRGVRDSFARLKNGEGPSWVLGLDLKLRLDLVPKYKPTSKFKVAKERLERLKIDLARKGFAVNRDVSTWRVYVLDIDPDVAPSIGNRGKLGKVIYVGQTSATVERRLAQHQGQILSKSGKFIGSSKVRNRNPTINKGLTPAKILFTEDDAKAFETKIHRRLETLGYRVLGDVCDK